MPLKNSASQYGTVTKAFHWVTAAIVICLLAVGLLMDDLPVGVLKLNVYNLHKSFGITVLVLLIGRICWHIINKKPGPVETLKLWEKNLAAAIHYSLYVLLIAQPLAGWLMSSAAGRAVSVFGLPPLPDLIEKNQETVRVYKELHGDIGTLIMIVLGLHIAAALKHHFLDKDIVLKRMLPVILAAAVLLLPSSTFANVRQWNTFHEKSSIAFRPKQLGTEFKGTFDLFTPSIAFAPDNLAESKAVIVIRISSAHTGAQDRDEALIGKDWFDAAQFPDARFETKSFRKTGEGTYEADAALTIRNITVPITLPFRLSIAKKAPDEEIATMDGSIILDRSKFQLGTGQLADTSIIANEVPVDIHLVALASPAKK